MLNLKVVALAVLLGLALPAAAQEDETFVEIKPGDISADPDNLIRGAEQGDVRALNNLGLLWARGVGVPAPDFKEAMRWWKEAAKRGYSLSMNNLGLLYANGHGVKQDYARGPEVVGDVRRAWRRLGHEQHRRPVRERPGGGARLRPGARLVRARGPGRRRPGHVQPGLDVRERARRRSRSSARDHLVSAVGGQGRGRGHVQPRQDDRRGTGRPGRPGRGATPG